jgi:putative flavoprotein involved in K+ transport
MAASGVRGGETVDYRRFAARGMTLVGTTRSFDSGVLRFAGDLKENIANGDITYLNILDQADEYVRQNGLDMPEEPVARMFGSEPDSLMSPISELDVATAGITSIIWATGFANDFGWLRLDVFDERGRPRHHLGVSAVPGIYFVGLPWLSRRESAFIWGVWHDAKHVADRIANRRSYLAYQPGVVP